MKRNKCARCSKIERLGRVFESISHNDSELFLCVECAKIIYKIEDARKEGNFEIANELRDSFGNGIKGEAQKIILLNWLSDRYSTN